MRPRLVHLPGGLYAPAKRPAFSAIPVNSGSVQARTVSTFDSAPLVKLGPKQWERYGLKSWIEAAKKRLHHNVLAIALANKLARIAWAVLNKGRARVHQDRCDGLPSSLILAPRSGPSRRGLEAWKRGARPPRRPTLTTAARGWNPRFSYCGMTLKDMEPHLQAPTDRRRAGCSCGNPAFATGTCWNLSGCPLGRRVLVR